MTKEDSFFKMLILSLLLHMAFLVALSFPLRKPEKKIHFPVSYSVNLVTSVGYGGGEVVKDKKSPPAHPSVREKRVLKVKKLAEKETVKRAEKERSISKKKVEPRFATKEELLSLEERIREIKSKTHYFNVSHTESRLEPKKDGGQIFQVSSKTQGGASSSLDPITQAYISEIWNRVKKAWQVPGGLANKKNLETVVIVKIRKDGRIVDVEIEKRSGNRIYDESALRTLRSVDPLPPFPQSLVGEYLEIGFRFLPGEVS